MEVRGMAGRGTPRAGAWAAAAVLLGLPAALAQVKRPDIHEFALDWFLAGTTIPSYLSLVLQPGVAGRGGYMWRLNPLNLADFELSVSFAVKKPPTRTIQNDGFALWYVEENATEALANLSRHHQHSQEEIVAGTWGFPFLSQDFDLLGYRSKYKGLGVFFMDGELPSISAVHNDGTKQLKLGSEIPAADAVKFDFMDERPVKVILRVQPGSSTVEIEGHGSIKLPVPLQAGGYVGFSCFGGTKEPRAYGPSERALRVEVKELEITNKDASAKPSEAGAFGALPQAEARTAEQIAENVLAESSNFKDHRAESDAIKDLTNMVFKLVVETQPMRMQMSRAIESLGKRITTMEKNFAELKEELDKKTGHKLAAEFDAIKKELTSLSHVASKETMERHKKLDSLHSDIADVHKSAHSSDTIDKHLDKLTQSNSKVIDKLTSEHQMMFGVSIAAIAFIIIAGLSLYNKFRCWEKKHIL